MKSYILLLAVLFISCKEKHNSASGAGTNMNSEIKKEFKDTDHLFLNYYFGMSVEEYEIATRVNFKQKKILISDDRSDCQLSRFNDKHTLKDIENITRLSKIYYAFGQGKEEFDAIIKPLFKNNRLVHIELRTLNCFTVGNHQHEFYREQVNKIHGTLVKLHTEKHGAYIKTTKNHSEQEIEAYTEAGIPLEYFDANKYVFNDNGTIISIEQRCCDFKPVIIYAVDDSRLEEIL